MTTPTVTETRRAGQTNEPVELARYTVSSGERVIRGQRVLGVVRLFDDPACGEGRHYVIERELTVMAELDAILTDYLEQSGRTDGLLFPAPGGRLLRDVRNSLAAAIASTPEPVPRSRM